jgi:hypothetical protein
MKAKFLVLCTIVFPIAATAGPLEDFIGTVVKTITEEGKSAPRGTNWGDNPNPGADDKAQLMDKEMRERIKTWDFSMGETIEEFCTKTRDQQGQKSPDNLPYLQDCEEKYSAEFNSAHKRHVAAVEQRAKAEKEQREAAIAEEEKRAAIAASGVSHEKAMKIAGDMYRADLSGGITEMLALENSCWKGLARQNNPSDDQAVSCVVTTISGAFIETANARRELRGMMPPYNLNTIRQHILDNLAMAKFSGERAERIIGLARWHQENIVAGLMYAGMR